MAIEVHPTCCIIGASSLLVKCAKIIQEAGWEIRSICSVDENVQHWAESNQVTHLLNYSLFKSKIVSQPPDFLFSIVNDIILDETVLKSVKQLSINYHDALLPDYAGMYASFWALFNLEKKHGITWHIMQPEIDSGPILIQKAVEIEPNETTLSLNLKCYEQAIQGFQLLLKQIAQNELQPIPQVTEKRVYNSLYKRPPNNGVLNFNQPALSVLKQWQAFEWGNNINIPIGTPKIVLNGQYYILDKIALLPEAVHGKPGTIYQIKENGIYIHTKDCMVQIEKLKRIYGDSQSLKDLQSVKITPNTLSVPETTHFQEQLYLKTVKKELYWVNRLLDLNYLQMPFVYQTRSTHHSLVGTTFQFPALNWSAWTDDKEVSANHYLSLLVLYLVRLSDQFEFDLPFYSNFEESLNLFNPIKPVKFKVSPTDNCSEAFIKILHTLENELLQPPILNDIIERYPILKNNVSTAVLQQFMFTVEVVDDFYTPIEITTDWHIQLNKTNFSWQIYCTNIDSNSKIAQHFVSTFQTFSTRLNSNAKVLDINVLPNEIWQNIVVDLNNNKIDFPNTLGIHQLFEFQVKTQPEAIALIFEDSSLTYKQLDHLSNQIAHALKKKGVNTNEKIGILLERNTNHIAAMLGVLKAGGCYVPLPPEYPIARLQYMISDSQIKWLVSESKIVQNLGLDSINYIDVNAITSFSSSTFEHPNFTPQDAAYVIYTSGSTGHPKGVPISHLNVINFLYAIRAVLEQKYKRIGAITAPFNFDVSVEEIFSTICFGGTAHIIPQNKLMEPTELVQYIYSNKINTIFITPALLPKMADAFSSETIQHLKYLLSGVQPKLNEVFKKFKNLSPELKIFNTYGPTEVTFGPTAYHYQGHEKDAEETPIGKGLPNYNLYVVNRAQKVVPNYIPGELLVGGPSVIAGYLNLPQLNQERFIQLPFGIPNDQQYCTGDMVYRDDNNDLHFIGRKDNQVKIRGFRIELGEIEAALQLNEWVENCVVLAKKVNQRHLQLVAYVVLKKSKPFSSEALKKALEKLLPKHAIPSYFIALENIPLHPNGKINYQNLPDVQPILENRIMIPPHHPTEIILHGIWQEVLQQKFISIEDNFFDIGGDSLTAIEVIEQFQQQHEKKISLAMFYNFQTIKSFVAAYNRDAGWNAANPFIQLKNGDETEPFFFIHGLNGSIAVLNHIIDALKVDNAFYAFQAASNYGTYTSLEALATDYIAHIKAKNIQKCVLCGFSFGGILAFELAHQLKFAGIEVNLIQLDSKPFVVLKHQRKHYYKLLYGAKVLQWLIRGNSPTMLATENSHNQLNDSNILLRLKKIYTRIMGLKNGIFKSSIPSMPVNMYQKTLLKSRDLVNLYQPKSYFIDMLLVKSIKEKEGFIGFGFKKNGWSKLTKGKIQIETIPICHYDFDKIENATKLASIIEKHCRQSSN